jgi:glycosyltransferase involved in cell wall biosynthesis
VVPVYNRTRYLAECLESVLAQRAASSAMEILVVDDASSSPVEPLVAKIGEGAVQYHRLARNHGLPASWNAGIALARGHWIHLLHDDDLVLPGFYSRLRDRLRAAPASVGAAFTGYENIDHRGAIVHRKPFRKLQPGTQQKALEGLAVQNPFNMAAVVVRRETYERLGGYHPELVYTSDWELYQRIAAHCDWWGEPEVLARYRVHGESKSAEMIAAGSFGPSLRRAIEIAAGYLPAAVSARLGAKARARCFELCVQYAGQLRKRGAADSAQRLIEEAARIDPTAATRRGLRA